MQQLFRRFNQGALRLFLRFLPTERQRVLLLTLIVGGVCGLAAVAFHVAIGFSEGLFIDTALESSHWIVWTLITTTLGGLVCGILLHYVVPDARGSGIPQVKVAYEVKGGRMKLRTVLGKFTLGVLQIGTGASLGREGPTVQICAGIASRLGQVVALPRRMLKMMLPVGAAAGIAAAFNAPIAAVTFVIEELIGDLNQAVLTGVIIAAALAAVVERSILGGHPVFDVPNTYALHHASSLILYTLLGLLAGVASLLMTTGLLELRRLFQRSPLPPWARPAVGGLLTGLLIVTGGVLLDNKGLNGASYAALGQALAGQLGIKVLLVFALLKTMATLTSYSSGGAGGLFAPTLCIGGMLGGAMGWLDVRLLDHASSEIGAFALVGMGAMFAGVIRAPITSVLIIFEMTDGYELILPLMIANMVAYMLARHFQPLAIYDALLEQDEIHLPHGRSQITHALERLGVQQAMTHEIITLSDTLTVAEALKQIASHPVSSFPVLNAQQEFSGLVSEARLRRNAAEGASERPIRQLVDNRQPAFADQNLASAVVMMDHQESRQLAVVQRHKPRHLVGMITMSDIIRAQAGAILDTTEEIATETGLATVHEMLEAQPSFRRVQAIHNVLATSTIADDQMVFYHQIVLAPGDPAVGRAVRSLRLPEGVLLVTLERANRTRVPRGDTLLQAGDRLTLFADPLHLPEALHALVEHVDGVFRELAR